LKKSFIVSYLFFILFITCGKSESQSESPAETATLSREMSPSAKMAEEMVQNEADESELRAEKKDILTQDKPENNLGKVFNPTINSTERLLEFRVILNYESSDIIKTRKELIQFISKYGYLANSSAVNSRSPYMSATIFVDSSKLYEALLDLDKLGVIQSEDITTIDHTEGMVWQKRKINREKIRLGRKNKANNQIDASSKNWSAIDESLTKSEDQMDLAEHETWKIQDRIKWATIQIQFSTPIPPDQIQVPVYKNAFIGLFNMFLELTYYLIWIIPFLLLGSGILYGSNFILKKFGVTIFKRK